MLLNWKSDFQNLITYTPQMCVIQHFHLSFSILAELNREKSPLTPILLYLLSPREGSSRTIKIRKV